MRAVRRGGLALFGALALVVFIIGSAPAEAPPLAPAPFARPAHIRVRLSSLGAGPWTLAGARLTEVATGRALPKTIDIAANTHHVTMGRESFDPIEIECRDGPLTLNGRSYVGRLSLRPGRSPRPVLSLDLERYVEQVLPKEMPLSYPVAALRAQAVAIRSYAVAEIRRRRRRAWDVVDTELSQVFGQAGARDPRTRTVVESVRDVVLSWDDKPLAAFFSSSCGGRTRSAAAAFGGKSQPAPLRGGTCGFCEWAREYRWRVTVSVEEFRRAAKLEFAPRRVVWEPGDDGRGRVVAVTADGRKQLSVSRLRLGLGGRRMRSTWVTGAERRGGTVTLRGLGFGHGVGLCQTGARGMADAGYDMNEILEHYFPGATLVELER